jgi:membrane-bound lytic murein transglycosylase D
MDTKERDELIAFYSQRFGIPTALSQAQMLAESSGNAQAVSDAGARGLFQMMPATAADLMLQPEPNIMVSRFYLKFLYDRIAALKAPSLIGIDRWRMAIAAYNGGLGMVHRVRVESANPDSYPAIAAQLPAETANYVARIWKSSDQWSVVSG